VPRANLDVGTVSRGIADAIVDLLLPVAFGILLALGDELDEDHSCNLKIGYALDCRRPNPS